MTITNKCFPRQFPKSLLFLSACYTTPEEENDVLVLPTPQELTSVSKSTQDGMTITIAVASGEKSSYQAIIDKFIIENPDVVVQISTTDEISQAANEPLELALARAVDIATVAYNPYDTRQIENRIWLNVKPFIDSDTSFQQDDFYTDTLDIVTHDNTIYAVPIQRSFNLLAYNKQLWKTRGLGEPNVNWGWIQLREALLTLGDTDGSNTTYGLWDEYGGLSVLEAALNGAGIDVTRIPGDIPLDDPRVVDVLTDVSELIQKKAVYAAFDGPNQKNSHQLQRLIKANQIGAVSSFNLGGTSSDAFGYIPFISSVLGSENTLLSYVISAGTDHPEIAWRLVSYLSRHQPKSVFPYRVGELPARASIAQRDDYWQNLSVDEASAITYMLQHAFIDRPVCHALYQELYVLSNALQRIVKDRQTPQRAVVEAQAALEQMRTQPTTTPQLVSEPIVVNTPVPEMVQPSDDVVTFGVAGSSKNIFESLARGFGSQNSNPDVQVAQIDFITEELDLDTLSQQYDCFVAPLLSPTSSTSSLLNIQPLLDGSTTLPASDYPPALIKAVERDGRLFGLPLWFSIPTLYYSPQRFEAAGLKQPTSDWSLDDIRRTAQELTGTAGDLYGFSAPGYQTAFIEQWLTASGVSIATRANRTITPIFTAPSVVTALNEVVDLLHEASPQQSISGYTRFNVSDGNETLINAGRVGMWSVAGINTQLNGSVLPFPVGSGIERLAPHVTIAFYISATTPRADRCWQWADFLSQQVIIAKSKDIDPRLHPHSSPLSGGRGLE